MSKTKQNSENITPAQKSFHTVGKPGKSIATNRKLFSLSLQPLTAFAELSYGRRDFAKTEGRKTEKRKVERVAEGEVGG